MNELIRINSKDNCAVAVRPLTKGDVVTVDDDTFTIFSSIPAGHKVALQDIAKGGRIIKYGYTIGEAAEDIRKGSHIHTFNIRSLFCADSGYSYDRAAAEAAAAEVKRDKWQGQVPTIMAYRRQDGRIGIRNSLWIIPTVGCVNGVASALAEWGNANLGIADGVHAYTHPFGCSQLGADSSNTARILADLIMHPNAGGVLVIGLGCETNAMASYEELPVDRSRVRFMACQEEKDEIAKGKELLSLIAGRMKEDAREPASMAELVIGLKCGGSTGLSGVTANPLVGRFCNEIVSMGGSAILTEIPEMFGAEQILMNRAASQEVYDKLVRMMEDYRKYFASHGGTLYDSPLPSDRAGGISTMEDKSLGCIQKGGSVPVSDVLEYGGTVSEPGLNILASPGNDIVSTTALSAAGAHLILFATGHGTPLGAPVPTVKIAADRTLAESKPGWVDFDASAMLEELPEAVDEALISLVASIASGEKRTRNEINGYSGISIYKDGVIL